MNTKRFLAAVFSLSLERKEVSLGELSSRLGVDRDETDSEARRLTGAGLVTLRRGSVSLTAKGRRAIRVVFMGGGFEIIHSGHLYTIEKAKELGDALVVSAARDSTIRRRKKREPIVGERERVKLLSALRQVDAAILGVQGDIYITLKKVSPDIVALGYDQYHLEGEIVREAKVRGMKLRVVRLGSPFPDIKTSKLLNEL